MPKDQDIDKIVRFLTDIKAIFSSLVFKKNNMFPPLLIDHMKQSWEGSVEGRMDHLIEIVKKTDQSVLKDVGLVDAELNFKLAGFNKAYEIWKNSSFKKVLKNLLEWINVILSSLAHLFPIAEPIKEFKDALEAGINSKKIWEKEKKE